MVGRALSGLLPLDRTPRKSRPWAARFLLDAYWYVGTVYRRLTFNASFYLSRALAEPLHILHLVRPILNRHEYTGRPVRVNTFLLDRRRQIPISDTLAELADGEIFELCYVQNPTGQLHIPIAFLQPAGATSLFLSRRCCGR